MRALVDTNVIIDSLQSREGFLEDAGEVVLRACDYEGYVSASSVTDIFYLQRRFFRDKKKARENLAELMKIFAILDTTEGDCRNALRSGIADFEDAVLAESALRNGIEVIVTRNKKDFEGVGIDVLTPKEFLGRLGV